MASREKIAVVVGMLAEAFGRKTTSAMFEAYHAGLKGVNDDLLTVAGNSALGSNREFMPTPGQLRELAITGGVGYEGRAERAWIEFDRAIVREGPDHTVSFADGLINATVRLLGDWIFCASRTGDDYGVWLRKEFLATYRRLCLSGANESLRQPLVGLLWRENALHMSDEGMAKATTRSINIGLPVLIKTSQPVLLPPSEAPKRIERCADVPRIELARP